MHIYIIADMIHKIGYVLDPVLVEKLDIYVIEPGCVDTSRSMDISSPGFDFIYLLMQSLFLPLCLQGLVWAFPN